MTEAVLDTQGIFDVTAALPEQVEEAVKASQGLEDLPDPDRIENIVVLGMGGSGIAGDILAAVAGPVPVPVIVSKGYELPGFVGEGSLVFAISFSGNTEEIIEAATVAATQGAHLVVITSGGELGRLAAGWGAPTVSVPASIPQPRAALGAMAIPPLVVLEDMGLFKGAGEWISLAVEQMKRRRDKLVGEKGLAAQIAQRIGRTMPLIHGGGGVGAAAAQRWKTQANENAKCPAFWAAHPELCHNEIAGWGQHGDVTRQVITLVNLRHEAEHPQTSRRFGLVAELVREVVADIIEVEAEGDGDLAQLFDLIYVGDMVTLHMAAREGIDPGPVDALVELKQALASS